MVTAEIVAGNGGQIVGLARVGVAEVAGQRNALLLQVFEGIIENDFRIVLDGSRRSAIAWGNNGPR